MEENNMERKLFTDLAISEEASLSGGQRTATGGRGGRGGDAVSSGGAASNFDQANAVANGGNATGGNGGAGGDATTADG